MFEYYFKNKVKKIVKLKRVEEHKAADRGVLIDSLEDLAANKTMALVERHAPKFRIILMKSRTSFFARGWGSNFYAL